MKHNNKSPKIGEAVFRGKKSIYNFEMFPLGTEFEDFPSVYLITRRKTDAKGKGHHALICIGQSESTNDELKKHAKGKHVKKLNANVVCVMVSENEKSRLKIEEDLRAAHIFDCLNSQ